VAVARSSSGSVAIRYVLLILWMMSCLAVVDVWSGMAILGRCLMSMNALLLLLKLFAFIRTRSVIELGFLHIFTFDKKAFKTLDEF